MRMACLDNDTCRSDGLQPHLINCQFQQKVPVSVSRMTVLVYSLHSMQCIGFVVSLGAESQHSSAHVSNLCTQEVRLYLDYKLDESYTPNKLSVRVGSSFQDLKVSGRHACPRFTTLAGMAHGVAAYAHATRASPKST